MGSATENSRARLANRPRCAWTNRKDFPRCPQKSHASLYQRQSVIWWKKLRPQNAIKQITLTSYSQKRMTKEAKLQIFGWLDIILLKRCYRTVIIWYAKLAPKRRKCFIEWGCATSHPTNPYWIYKSHHVSGKQAQKLSLNTMSCTPEHGSVNMRIQFLIGITIIW